MAKKKKNKSKQPKKRNLKPKDYECFSYGPLRLERIGRYVKFSSEWRPGEHAEFMKEMQARRPEFKNEIDKKVNRLITLINQYDSLDFLFSVSIKNCFGDPEVYKESEDKKRECYVEYAQSLIVSQERKIDLPHPTREITKNFNDLIAIIINDVINYFASEVAEKKVDMEKQQVRFISIINYLGIRGDSFQEHHIDLIKGIFEPHDRFFTDNHDSTCERIIAGIQDIENQILNKLKQQVHFYAKAEELHEIFKQFIDREGIEGFSSLEECRRKFHSLPEVQEKMADIPDTLTLNSNIFEIQPSPKTSLELLALLSAKFQDNKEFADFVRSPGWPTNNSIIYDRPLIRDNGKYYCFGPQLLFRNIGNILEGLIQDKDKKYFEETY